MNFRNSIASIHKVTYCNRDISQIDLAYSRINFISAFLLLYTPLLEIPYNPRSPGAESHLLLYTLVSPHIHPTPFCPPGVKALSLSLAPPRAPIEDTQNKKAATNLSRLALSSLSDLSLCRHNRLLSLSLSLSLSIRFPRSFTLDEHRSARAGTRRIVGAVLHV